MPNPIPLKVLQDLYYEEKLSVPEIASRLGMSRQAVYERFRNNGMSLRDSGPKTRLEKGELSDLYENQKLTVKEIARQLGCSMWDVTKDLERYEISRSYNRPSKFKFIGSLKEGENIRITRERGTHPAAVLRLAKKLGIRVVIRKIDATGFSVIRTPHLTDDNVLAMRDSGMNITKIAKVFRCGVARISQCLRQAERPQ